LHYTPLAYFVKVESLNFIGQLYKFRKRQIFDLGDDRLNYDRLKISNTYESSADQIVGSHAE